MKWYIKKLLYILFLVVYTIIMFYFIELNHLFGVLMFLGWVMLLVFEPEDKTTKELRIS